MTKEEGNLFDILLELTGLSREILETELQKHMEKLSLNPKSLSTDDLRRVMESYILEIHEHMAEDSKEMPADFMGFNPASPLGDPRAEA